MTNQDEQPTIRVEFDEGDCRHCAFVELAEALVRADHDPEEVIRQMAGALADVVAGLVDEGERARVTMELVVAFPTLVAEFFEEREDGSEDDHEDDETHSFHKPGNARIRADDPRSPDEIIADMKRMQS